MKLKKNENQYQALMHYDRQKFIDKIQQKVQKERTNQSTDEVIMSDPSEVTPVTCILCPFSV